MSTVTQQIEDTERIPPLVAGDRLTRDEFERRYHAMPEVKKAELIEGVVYMPSPVSHARHGAPHALLTAWLVNYMTHTPGVDVGDNSTVRLDLDNEPQPDANLRILPELGGQTEDNEGGYIEGPPELTAEVTATTAAYDLHDKLNAYRRNGVREYVVWRVVDEEIDWFVLHRGRYEKLARSEDRIFRSVVFPGLWLDADALLRRDMRTVQAVLDRGLESDDHAAFVERLLGDAPRD